MNFLNEVVLDYPAAISLAPGRPPSELLDVPDHLARLGKFVASGAQPGGGAGAAAGDLGQYSRTNGTICNLVAAHLERDEGIRVDASAIMMTVGAQEAMAVLVAGLFEPAEDILLVSDPTYVGITGVARLLGVRTLPVPASDDGLTVEAVERAIAHGSQFGRVRALYDIPDFNNPLGTSLTLETRLALLELCSRRDVLIIEDNPYGMFAYDHERLPTFKALDQSSAVVYIGTFSKTLFPALRVGYLVADQRVTPGGCVLAQELSVVKGFMTVNTSGISQAIVGTALRDGAGSLERWVAPKRAQLRDNRDVLLEALRCEFRGMEHLVQWTRPAGGFFATLALPFEFGAAELRRCARDYGVVVCPMQFFSLQAQRANQVRLAFSFATREEIRAGVVRLVRFVREECMARNLLG